MSYVEDGKSTFAEDRGISPGILEMIAKIANNSLTTFKQREKLAQKYYDALERAEAKRKLVGGSQK